MGLPPRSLPPPSPLLEVVRAPPPRRTVGGDGSRAPGRGTGPCLGLRPAALSPPHAPGLIALASGARPSPASSLALGLGLRQRRVPPAVAPVGEGVAQGW